MENADLNRYKSILEEQNRCYKSNMAYANGKNPTIIDKNVKKDPDNRIPVPLAKMAVTDMAGYAGRAGDTDIKVLDKDLSEQQAKEYKTMLLQIAEHNKAGLENAELYEEALTHGVAYELFWVSDDLNLSSPTPEYKIIPATQMLPVYSCDLKPRLEKAIRFYKDHNTEFAEVYLTNTVEHYHKPKGSDVWVLNPDKGENGITEHPFKAVPLAVYPINRFTQPLFEAEKAIIDAHDDLISKSTNEIDRFNALKLLMPGLVTKEMADKIAELGIIANLGEDKNAWPEYLEKNLGGVDTFYNSLADRLERLYHKSIKIPDMTAESFAGGAQSGVAISYKLIGMEFKASQIDTYFDQGLNRRIELINNVLIDSFSYVADTKVIITHKRNLPVDEMAKADLAIKLKGKISNEAYLRLFPKSIINDVSEEIERLEAEPDRELLELYVLALNGGNKVPAQLVADALKIDRTEWASLSIEEKKATIDALSKNDENIEQDLIENDNL